MSGFFYDRCRRWAAGNTGDSHGTSLTTPNRVDALLKGGSKNPQNRLGNRTQSDPGSPPTYDSLLQPYGGPSKALLHVLRGMSKDKDIIDRTVKDEVTEALVVAPTISIVDSMPQEMRDRAVKFAKLLDHIDMFLDKLPDRLNDVLLFRTELVRLQRAISFGCRPGTKPHGRLARFLHNLAMSLDTNQRPDEACSLDEEALAIHDECCRANPSAERALHAKMLWAYSVHLYAAERYEDALQATEDELKIRRLLYEFDSDESMALSRALHDRAIYFRQLRRFEDAKDSEEEALVLRRTIYEEDPEKHRTALLECLNSYITTLKDLGLPKETREAQAERDKIRNPNQ
ncbi:hypothetical protein DL93DRAFT_2172508 [Clavulina sp. PMI_390]|nr:hypothetical protein DL93DRAFT_2172508 [Clavulina sp. PMI_390]